VCVCVCVCEREREREREREFKIQNLKGYNIIKRDKHILFVLKLSLLLTLALFLTLSILLFSALLLAFFADFSLFLAKSTCFFRFSNLRKFRKYFLQVCLKIEATIPRIYLLADTCRLPKKEEVKTSKIYPNSLSEKNTNKKTSKIPLFNPKKP